MHTPGPLTIRGPSPGDNTGCDDGGDYAIIDDKGKIIAEAISKVGFASGDGYDTRPAKANAQLYASAPDLLEALEDIQDAFSAPGVPNPRWIKATVDKAIENAK